MAEPALSYLGLDRAIDAIPEGFMVELSLMFMFMLGYLSIQGRSVLKKAKKNTCGVTAATMLAAAVV
jgi:hypothetical protein